MRRAVRRLVPGGALLLLLAGCAQVQTQDQAFGDVQAKLAGRLPQQTTWLRGAPEDAQAAEAVRTLLAKPIGPDEAVQIALLRHRGLQATYEELGVAQADLVQAGLLQNPIFSSRVRWGNGGGGPNVEFSLAQNFVSLLFLPARTKIATASFEAAKSRVAAEVYDHAVETRSAFLTYVAALQLAEILRESARGAEAASDLSDSLFKAGNRSELVHARERASFESARIELARAEAEAASAREKVTRLMGLAGRDADWRAVPRLPELAPETLPFDRLETIAIERNLKFAAARRETEALAQQLGYARRFAWLGDVEIGVDTEREPGGDRMTGPSIAFPLPLFDNGQSERARALAQLRQSEQRLLQQAIDLRSQVREQRDRVIRTRALAEQYGKVLIPLQRKIVEFGLQHYNAMVIGVFDVLAAKQNEIAAYRSYVEAVRDHWIARTELARALGGALPSAGES